MPTNPSSAQHYNIPSQIAQITVAELLAIEMHGGKLHTYRDSRNGIRMYISNVQDIKKTVGLREVTRQLIEHHIANGDQVIHLL